MTGAPLVLACGHATLDRLGDATVPGGSVYYAAHALAALGARVRVLTAAGPDLPPDAFQARPAAAGAGPAGSIEAVVLPCAATTCFVNEYPPGGRRRQRVLGSAPQLDPARLPEAWRAADVLHLAPVVGELSPAAFAAAVRARVVGLQLQGLVRDVRPDGAVVPRPFAAGADALAGVSAAVLGEEEASAQPDLVERLASSVPIVVLTRGARGCEVIAGGRARRVGVHPAAEVDPTGAGDVFAAAFFLALARGDDPIAAARLGAAAASIVVEGLGGEALPRIAEAWRRIARVLPGAP